MIEMRVLLRQMVASLDVVPKADVTSNLERRLAPHTPKLAPKTVTVDDAVTTGIAVAVTIPCCARKYTNEVVILATALL